MQQLLEVHRAQLIHYLMLADLKHGKLLNFRTARVEHEFVNTLLSTEQRRQFTLDTKEWTATTTAHERLQDLVVGLCRDWGTGLQLSLYEEAISHFFACPGGSIDTVPVTSNGKYLGTQAMRLIDASTAVKVTSLTDMEIFSEHARKLLRHTSLETICWINIQSSVVSFNTLTM